MGARQGLLYPETGLCSVLQLKDATAISRATPKVEQLEHGRAKWKTEH